MRASHAVSDSIIIKLYAYRPTNNIFTKAECIPRSLLLLLIYILGEASPVLRREYLTDWTDFQGPIQSLAMHSVVRVEVEVEGEWHPRIASVGAESAGLFGFHSQPAALQHYRPSGALELRALDLYCIKPPIGHLSILDDSGRSGPGLLGTNRLE
jgi:hypothetical protein